jgi:hypothetical protein
MPSTMAGFWFLKHACFPGLVNAAADCRVRTGATSHIMARAGEWTAGLILYGFCCTLGFGTSNMLRRWYA